MPQRESNDQGNYTEGIKFTKQKRPNEEIWREKEKRKMESFDFMLRSEIQSAAFDTSLVMALLQVVKQ